MSTELIIIREYCKNSIAEPQFIDLLWAEGLIEVVEQDGELYLPESQLSLLDRYTEWYYELSINIEGIDVIQNLLNKISTLQEENRNLRQQMWFIDDENYQ